MSLGGYRWGYTNDYKMRKPADYINDLIDIVSWPEGISVSADVSERDVAASSFGIRFNPDGSATGGTIRFGAGRAIYEVSVSWLTGQVRRDREF